MQRQATIARITIKSKIKSNIVQSRQGPYQVEPFSFFYCILYYFVVFLLVIIITHWQVLIYTAGHINYGGRVTDDWDRRCMMNVLSDYYNDNVIKVAHQYDASGVYKQLDPSTDLEVIVTLCNIVPYAVFVSFTSVYIINSIQIGRRSFTFAGPSLWNRFLAALRRPKMTLHTFKRQLKAYLFHIYPSPPIDSI